MQLPKIIRKQNMSIKKKSHKEQRASMYEKYPAILINRYDFKTNVIIL